MRKMHSAGVSVADRDQYGWLLIHRAAANDRCEIIKLLVEWGSPLEATGTEQWTPLHLASVSMSSRAVGALIEAGANVHARSVFGATPLHLAVGSVVTEASLETVRVLLSAGADPNVVDQILVAISAPQTNGPVSTCFQDLSLVRPYSVEWRSAPALP